MGEDFAKWGKLGNDHDNTGAAVPTWKRCLWALGGWRQRHRVTWLLRAWQGALAAWMRCLIRIEKVASCNPLTSATFYLIVVSKMFRFVKNFVLLLVVVLPAVVLLSEGDVKNCVFASEPLEDSIDITDDDDDDDEGQVETEDADTIASPAAGESVVPVKGDDDDEDDEDRPLKASSDSDTYFLFVKPSGTDLPAGTIVSFLVGFTNKGSKNFTLNTLDASFRYPMDFSYHIYNFSTVQYSRLVKPKEQVTLSYSFIPSESFAARPFGLTVNLNYLDDDGNQFLDAVFNETVNIIELDEGLDGETVFLYLFLAAVVVLLFIGGQQLFLSYGGKKRFSKPKHIETGTVKNSKDIDYDWIPKETLNQLRKLEKKSPRQSPRERRTRRTGMDN